MADDRDARIAQLEVEIVALREQAATAVDRAARAEGALADALEQQTATAEVLQVIARSPTDQQQVLDTIAQSVIRLCQAENAVVYRRDGAMLIPVALCGPIFRSQPAPGIARPLDPLRVEGRAVLDARTVHVADILSEEDGSLYPVSREASRQRGWRSAAIAPLLWERAAIGAIDIFRRTSGPFTEQQIRLLESFADQAVIAIENARLFSELEQRNTDLNEALEQQTASAEVMRAIATSPTDLEAVLQAILDAAARLCDAEHGVLQQRRARDGRLIPWAGHGFYRLMMDEQRAAGGDWIDRDGGLTISTR